ncbi:hypothetical protein MHYP_G00303550 [Metynnis hypsauchen]
MTDHICWHITAYNFHVGRDRCSSILAGLKGSSFVWLHWCEPHRRGPRYQAVQDIEESVSDVRMTFRP